MKVYLFTLVLALFCLYCTAQTLQLNKQDTISLHKLIFHSSRCNGTCPSISLEIDSSGNIAITREVYKTKSGIDKLLSGQFRGALTATDYNELKSLLQDCNLTSLQFPPVDCCDGAVKTIIVYYNNQRKYLRSMIPPEKAGKLISFLTQVGMQSSLPRVNELASIEE